jgi:hypothetical protein
MQENPMGKYTQWIEYKNHKILFSNFAGIHDEAEYIRAFDEMEQEVIQHSKGHQVLVLTDVTNTVLTQAVNERSKKMTAAARAAGVPDSPTAMVGLAGFQKAVVQALQFFRHDIYIASDLEDGKDWLVKQVTQA